MEKLNKKTLYSLQEAVLDKLQAMGDVQFKDAKLCGQTALSRFWLNHCLSDDLEFFLPQGFCAKDMAIAIKNANIPYKIIALIDHPKKINQLYSYIYFDGAKLKVSFIEDGFYELSPAVEKNLGSLMIKTEEIPALYYRKLRAIANHAGETPIVIGGRKTARDLFDLYVLSHEYKTILEFVPTLSSLPMYTFMNGLTSMPWYELIEDLARINCAPKWNKAKKIDILQHGLLNQISTAFIPKASDLEEDQRKIKNQKISQKIETKELELV